MENQVQEFEGKNISGSQTADVNWFYPKSDVLETETELKIFVEMPGVPKDQVDLEVENNLLKVEGKLTESRLAVSTALHSEFKQGHYSRSFGLGDQIDSSHINAELIDGVLEITLPKREETQPKKIEIN